MKAPQKKPFSLVVKVQDKASNNIVGSGIILVVVGNTIVKTGTIKQGVCTFDLLTERTFKLILPYKIQQSASGGRWIVPFCEIDVEENQTSHPCDFIFDSGVNFDATNSAEEFIADSYVGEKVKLGFTATDSEWKISIGDKVFDSGADPVIQRTFNSPGTYDFSSTIKIKPVNGGITEAYDVETGTVVTESTQSLNVTDTTELALSLSKELEILPLQPQPVTAQNFTVSHARKIIEPNVPMSFFVHLLNSSKSVEFSAYQTFINQVLCADPPAGLPNGHALKLNRLKNELTDFGVGAYELLKTATEAFLLLHGCITPAHNGSTAFSFHQNLELGDYSRVPKDVWTSLFSHYLGDNKLPYIKHIIDSALPEYEVPDNEKNPRFCADILIRSRVNNPCFMELIWNYWHEEAMLVQTINAISRRFQNLRAPGERDPLAHMEIDPLRPLNNILWGYVEEERDRLSIKRRAHEYQHQYGLELYGKAVSNLRPADNRSKFLEAFHNLLNKCADYFRAKQDTTVDPDGYPMLHAIQELNLILAHGAHNQFGDLAWTSRVEMLMQEWILSRPEIRDFLQSRVMVPHKEAWMPQVDTMKTLQGWSDVPVTHFRDLGVLGEQILLTIRWHNWYEVTNEDEAKGWADLLRPHIQSYIHSYRAVTGVDLSVTDGVDFTMPSVLLRKRLATQHAPR